jgi:hypothetical protein
MATSRIQQLADRFSKKLDIIKSAQEAPVAPTVTEEAPNYNQIAKELNSVIQGFLARNQMKMATTKPAIQEQSANQQGTIAVGFIIPTNEYDAYMRKLHNEIQKLQQKYPGINLRAVYDINDPRKAKI